MNATKHSEVETLIVLEEDPQVLDDRRAACLRLPFAR